MEVLHTINLINAKITIETYDSKDKEKKDSLLKESPTLDLPILSTQDGNISKPRAIEYFLCSKYKPELLGNTPFEKAKINQWVEFAYSELRKSSIDIIYPIFGLVKYNKEEAHKAGNNMKNYLKTLENNLKNNKYIVGEKITLADIAIFSQLRYFMMLHFPEKMRKSLFPETTKWFENIMNMPETIKAYGKTVLCKNTVNAFTGEIKKKKCEPEEKVEKKEEKKEEEKKIEKKEEENDKKNKKKEKKDKKQKENKNENKNENKKEKNNDKKEEEKKEKPFEPYVPSLLEINRFNLQKKENNPLDALPPSKFDLEKFKNDFTNSQNKKEEIEKLLKDFDNDGYSMWFIEYNNEPTECVTLFRTVIIKGDILCQLEYFKKYCFGVLGVYGSDGDYKISGCMMWRGKEIPDEIKEIKCFNKLKLRKLDLNDKKDQDTVCEYWTNINENDVVSGKKATDARYFP